jgi:hypothetical protein
MVLAALACSITLQVWAWRRLSERISRGALSRVRAFLWYGLWAFLPVLVVMGAFLLAVGLEEWLEVAVIPEPLARATPLAGIFLVVVSTMGCALFAVRCALGGHPAPPNP